MCGAISTPCETQKCTNFTKEVYCVRCEANMAHLTGV